MANEVTPIPTGALRSSEQVPTIYLPRSSTSPLSITMKESKTELERRRKSSRGNAMGLGNEIVTIDVERRDDDDLEWSQDNGRHVTK